MFTEEHVSIYICGSENDATLRDELIKQLRPPKYGTVSIHHHDTIKSGKNRKAVIEEYLAHADIILFLISPDFVDDDECRGEVERALERYHKGEADVIPVKLRPIDISGEPYGDLQALPPGKFVTRWLDQDDALFVVARGVSQAVDESLKRKKNRRDKASSLARDTSTVIDKDITHTSTALRDPERKRKKAMFLGLALLLIGIGLVAVYPVGRAMGWIGPVVPASPTPKPNGEQLPADLSVGGTIFDTQRTDGHLKQEAADSLSAGRPDLAQGFLAMASEEDSSDAEALIYQENLSIMQNGSPYVTLAVPVKLTGGDVTLNSTRATLQGVYVAQYEYNSNSQHNQKVRLLLANLDNASGQARETIQDIKNSAQRENIIGIVGRPLTRSEGVDIVESMNIPLVASQASCNVPLGVANFFSVAPPLKDEVKGVVAYARGHARNIAVYYDPSYPGDTGYYDSQCLYNEFMNQFRSDGLTPPTTRTYSTGREDTLIELASAAKQNQVDFIYFLGPLADVGKLLADLRAIGYQKSIKVLGTNMLYQYVYAPADLAQSIEGVYFTSFAFHGVSTWNCTGSAPCNAQWDCARKSACAPPFFGKYDEIFNPGGHRSPIHYGYTWPDSDAILAYDATSILLYAYDKATITKASSPGIQIMNSLTRITPQQPFAGVSGHIGFGHDGYPVDKAVLILLLQGSTQWEATPQGHYQ